MQVFSNILINKLLKAGKILDKFDWFFYYEFIIDCVSLVFGQTSFFNKINCYNTPILFNIISGESFA